MRKATTFLLLIVLATAWSCKKDEEITSTNPYNNPALWPPPDTTTDPSLDSSSFQFLYHNVFSITCANSGCHDGNFPPDFRTIYSSYNTLVNHPVIQNDAQQSFNYRVEPFDVEKSLIYTRLTTFMPNTSGIMPLSLEPESDWPDNKDTYIQLIKEWIEAGAPDTYGQVPGSPNLNPQVVGIMVFNSGSTTNPLPREDNKSTKPVIIPKQAIDVWLAFSDDQTPPSSFPFTQLKSSRNLFDFSMAELFTMSSSSPVQGLDFWGQTVNYTHKATLNFPNDTSNTFIYLRSYVQEIVQGDTSEAPNDGTSDIMRSYFTLKIDSL
ncbi:MAG: hypothetical protein RIE58_00350 [Vicingaceae bacterium]